MILSALMELAEYEGLVEAPDFQPMPVRWLVDVGPGGVLLGVTDTQRRPDGGKGKSVTPAVMVPKRSKRTSGVQAEFIVDKPSYVFGWVHPDAVAKAAKEGKPESRVRDSAAKQFTAYVAEIRQAAKVTSDEGLVAWLALLEAGGPPAAEFPGWTEGDLVSPRYDPDGGLSLAERPAVAEHWKASRAGPAGSAASAAAGSRMCLVSGQQATPVRLHPSIKGVPPVADTKGGVPFTSINADAFDSYGLREVGGATVSQAAADAYQAALNRLLSDGYPHPRNQGETLGKQNVRLSDDTVVVFWAKDTPVGEVAEAVERGEPRYVADLYRSAWAGSRTVLDEKPFYALTLSGAIGRGTVRGWHETTLGAAVRNLKTYFEDVRVHRRAEDDGKPLPLLALVRQTSAQGKLENVPAALAGDIFLAVLSGQAVPRSVLEALVRRVRAERTIYAERAAFLKAYLVRARRRDVDERRVTELPEVGEMLDDSCKDTGYCLGRLFAVLEKLQDDAIGAKASIRDRYYGAASATPAVVFPQLLRKVPHHLGKLGGALETVYEKLIQRVAHNFAAQPFPATLPLESQGLFALGYYHQRQDLFTKREKPADAAAVESDPTPATQEG